MDRAFASSKEALSSLRERPIALVEKGSGRAADQVARDIESRIESGQLAPGSTLPAERDLMEEFSTSRTVVREAIRQLSNLGLVEARPRFRPVVRSPGFDSALDAVGGVVRLLLNQKGGVRSLFDTRVMIEVYLVREAALRATKEDIAALSKALDANKEAIENSEKFYETDMDFHKVLYQVPKNPVLNAIQKAYTDWLGPHWSAMPRLPDRNRKNYEHHRAIYEAILIRDPDLAEASLRAHLRDAWDQVSATFGEI